MAVSDLDPRPNASTSLDPSNPAWNAPAGLRIAGDVYLLTGAGAPVDNSTGDNFAGIGSSYFDVTNGNAYLQTGVITSPVWKLVTRAA
jgi:hypothetical protein